MQGYNSYLLGIVSLGIVLMAESCATSPSLEPPVVFNLDAPENVPVTISILDRRDSEDKTYRRVSIFNPFFRLGDENFSPDRLKVLAFRFQNKVDVSTFAQRATSPQNVDVDKFEVTIFPPPPPGKNGTKNWPFILNPRYLMVIAEWNLLDYLTTDKRDTLIVVCEIQGSAGGRIFKGTSDRVVPDPKADLSNAIREVVREAIDAAADNLVQGFP